MDQRGNYLQPTYGEAEARLGCMLEGYLDTGKARDNARRAGLLREYSDLAGPEGIVDAGMKGP